MGQTGTANLTELADNAPPAAGNPFAYVDTATGLLIVIYRGKDDGNVYCIYGSGDLVHENLTAAVEAKADGNPVGYFTPATNTHHVIYRSSDKHLHVLRWAGAESAHHHDMTNRAGAGAPAAVGDPSAFVDPTRGLNLVVYRGKDGHIHDIYWGIDTARRTRRPTREPVRHRRHPTGRGRSRRLLHRRQQHHPGDLPRRRQPPL